MATHTLVNYGYFYESFHRLKPGENLYWKKGSVESPVTLPPKEFDGIKFGYMDGSHETFLVRVDDLLLRAPVLFVGGRHGPQGPGPSWAKLDNDMAARILVDVILANPEFRDVLAEKIRKLG